MVDMAQLIAAGQQNPQIKAMIQKMLSGGTRPTLGQLPQPSGPRFSPVKGTPTKKGSGGLDALAMAMLMANQGQKPDHTVNPGGTRPMVDPEYPDPMAPGTSAYDTPADDPYEALAHLYKPADTPDPTDHWKEPIDMYVDDDDDDERSRFGFTPDPMTPGAYPSGGAGGAAPAHLSIPGLAELRARGGGGTADDARHVATSPVGPMYTEPPLDGSMVRADIPGNRAPALLSPDALNPGMKLPAFGSMLGKEPTGGRWGAFKPGPAAIPASMSAADSILPGPAVRPYPETPPLGLFGMF